MMEILARDQRLRLLLHMHSPEALQAGDTPAASARRLARIRPLQQARARRAPADKAKAARAASDQAVVWPTCTTLSLYMTKRSPCAVTMWMDQKCSVCSRSMTSPRSSLSRTVTPESVASWQEPSAL